MVPTPLEAPTARPPRRPRKPRACVIARGPVLCSRGILLAGCAQRARPRRGWGWGRVGERGGAQAGVPSCGGAGRGRWPASVGSRLRAPKSNRRPAGGRARDEPESSLQGGGGASPLVRFPAPCPGMATPPKRSCPSPSTSSEGTRIKKIAVEGNIGKAPRAVLGPWRRAFAASLLPLRQDLPPRPAAEAPPEFPPTAASRSPTARLPGTRPRFGPVSPPPLGPHKGKGFFWGGGVRSSGAIYIRQMTPFRCSLERGLADI